MTFEQEESRRPKNVTLSWPALEPVAVEPEPMLPQAYGRTALKLLVRDPMSLYAFWEIAPGITEQVHQDSAKVLRIYEITHKQTSYSEIGIGEAKSWYISGTKPDTIYYAELGLILPDGHFLSLARSNQVRSPRNSFSDVTDEEWLTIEELYGMSVGLTGMSGSEEILTAARIHLEQQLGSEAVSSISSPWGAYSVEPAHGQEADLLLETFAVITIQGKTTPGAVLSINGQPISPDSAGQFVYSLPLPDGELDVQIVAASADRKMRKEKTLELTRRTR